MIKTRHLQRKTFAGIHADIQFKQFTTTQDIVLETMIKTGNINTSQREIYITYYY